MNWRREYYILRAKISSDDNVLLEHKHSYVK
jgi:hypothetical protein